MIERIGAILLVGNLELRRLAGIERRDFLGYPVDSLSADDIVRFVESAILNNARYYFAVQNANKMYLADRHPRLKHLISQADVILPENAINIGMSLVGSPLKAGNMGGVKVMGALLELADKKGFTVYFLGGTRDNLNKMVVRLSEEFRNLKISGHRDGYFQDLQTVKVVQEIAALRPNLLFVGMGSPKQEFFIGDHLSNLNVNIAMGVGGSFNVFAGIEKPAPAWSKHGLEWLYRSFQDPSKFKRYMVVNTYFIYKLGWHLLVERWRG